MTTTQQEDNKARGLFTTVMVLAGGFAGLAVAGLVLGLDYLLHGEPHERERLAQLAAERRRNRYADALAWLENDHAERERFRQRRRDWFAADPETRGDAPSNAETFGRVLARTWNWLLVGGVRFKRGWRKGREEATQRRDNGDANWWKRKPDERAADKPSTQTDDTPPQPAPQRPAGNAKPKAQKDSGPEIIDAEIVDDPAQPASREVVPVNHGTPERGPDEAMDDYQRRLDELAQDVASNGNQSSASH